jgi:CheY-like chemotaxis protein
MAREGFAAVLRPQLGLLVVCQAADGADAVSQTRQLNPDVVLMAVRMPVMDGLQATRHCAGQGSLPRAHRGPSFRVSP